MFFGQQDEDRVPFRFPKVEDVQADGASGGAIVGDLDHAVPRGRARIKALQPVGKRDKVGFVPGRCDQVAEGI
ncbi:hypothetical protein D3C73_1622300 [compost metagenome]